MNEFRPLGNRLLVKLDKVKEKTDSGFYLPDEAKEGKAKTGMVLALGDCDEVNLGDHVVFGAYAGSEVKVNGDDSLVLNEDDVVAIIRDGRTSWTSNKGEVNG